MPYQRRDPISFEGRKGFWSYRVVGKRAPKKGEHYLSGAIVAAYLAPNDLTAEYSVVIPLREFVMRSEWQLANRQRRPYIHERRYEDAIPPKEI